MSDRVADLKKEIRNLNEIESNLRRINSNFREDIQNLRKEISNLTDNYNTQSLELLRANQTVEALQYALKVTHGNLEVAQKILLKHGILEIQIKSGRNALVENAQTTQIGRDKLSLAVSGDIIPETPAS